MPQKGNIDKGGGSMKKIKYKCRRCGNTFVAEVFEPGEAEAKRVPAAPVCCPECGGPVERV
jgi:transposase-like protein